jgi:pyruvate formate lyase activating enzyme
MDDEQFTVSTDYWTELDDGTIRCDVCPRACKLNEGQRGMCFVRKREGDEVVLTTYGRSSGFCIDPIEKKPLNHFLPGTPVLSFGTAGCNLMCKFCQNHDISKSREIHTLADQASPELLAEAADDLGCRSIAFTYNDPVIFLEYAVDVAKECQKRGIDAVAVSAGYVNDEPRREFYEHMDAANIDLKAFTEDFYKQLTVSELEPVLETLEYLEHETDVWYEITNLVIPEENDGEAEIREMCEWVVDHLGRDVPIHFSAFHPDYKMDDKQRTPPSTLRRARRVARDAGIKYAYVGNIHDREADSTYCHACGELVIARDWYELGEWHLDAEGCCEHCGAECAGVFEADSPGDWGRDRQPVRLGNYRDSTGPAAR